jgi:hypothetical protein
MSRHEEALLIARFIPLAPAPLEGDWDDVLERAARARSSSRRTPHPRQVYRGRRRLVAFAVVALVLAAGGSTAFAIRAYVLHQGIVGLAPEGATPSTPTRGEVVLSFMFGHDLGDAGRFAVTVYADGRMIWQRLDGTGVLERRLTPEGVRLVRSQVIATGLLDWDAHFLTGPWLYNEDIWYGSIEVRTGNRLVQVTWGDINHPRHVPRVIMTEEQARTLARLDARLENPAAWLPASAWTDREIKAYVPPGYSVCVQGKRGLGLAHVLALLPPTAANLLRHHENARQQYTNRAGTFQFWCSTLSTHEAHALERILDDAGIPGTKDEFGLAYGPFDPADFKATDYSVTFNPLSP